MWSKFKLWMMGISQSVWNVFYPILKAEVAQFVTNIQPIVLKAITEANANKNMDNAAKYAFVKTSIKEYLTANKQTYTESGINLAIELIYQTTKVVANSTTTK